MKNIGKWKQIHPQNLDQNETCIHTPLQVKSIPVRRDDEVLVKTGHFKGREGKIQEVYRKKWAVYVDKVQREKANGNYSLLFINSFFREKSVYYFIILQNTNMNFLVCCTFILHSPPRTGTTVNVPLNANKLVITKLKIDNSRKRILERLASKKKADKGKVTQQDVSMAQVD